MSLSAHSAFLCDRLLNMFCSAAYKLAPPFGHIKVELCPGLEPNSWTKSAKPQCLCGIILFVLLYRNHQCVARFRLLSYKKLPLFLIIAKVVFAGLGRLYGACATHLFCALMRGGKKDVQTSFDPGSCLRDGQRHVVFFYKFPRSSPCRQAALFTKKSYFTKCLLTFPASAVILTASQTR